MVHTKCTLVLRALYFKISSWGVWIKTINSGSITHIRLKTVKNYKYIFWFLVEVAIENAYILSKYSPSTDLPMGERNLKCFRMKLATQLIDNYNSRKRRGRPRSNVPSPDPQRPCLEHFPSRSRSRRCVYCHRHRTPPRRRESIWTCTACEGHPSLCLTGLDDGSNCFKLWHNL